MNTKIKICGIKREEDTAFVNALNPDYIGFVFAESKRKVSHEEASMLRKKINSQIKVAGVFVNADMEEIITLVKQDIIQLVQLHGDEEEDYICKLKKACQIPVIKVIRVGKERPEIRETSADYLLFDSERGGSGQTFLWELLPKEINKPFFLAGGLKKENILEAIQKVAPFALDISSGVETDGCKDLKKMQEVFRRIRNE